MIETLFGCAKRMQGEVLREASIEELKSLIIRPSTRHLLLLYQKVFLLSYLLLALLGTETLFGCAKRMQGEVLREASNENSAPTSAALL